MDKIKVSRAVIVEGRYDKAKLSSLIDGVIIQTDGFRIYKDREKIAMIRALANQRGLLILTDSDRAGFQLRNFIRSIAKGADIRNVYIPQIKGKEKRKAVPGKEHLLGVEGIDADCLRTLIEQAGALDREEPKRSRPITKLDFFEDGLSGGADAKKKRESLLKKLGLPTYLSQNSLLDVINGLITYEEYRAFCKQIKEEQ